MISSWLRFMSSQSAAKEETFTTVAHFGFYVMLHVKVLIIKIVNGQCSCPNVESQNSSISSEETQNSNVTDLET